MFIHTYLLLHKEVGFVCTADDVALAAAATWCIGDVGNTGRRIHKEIIQLNAVYNTLSTTRHEDTCIGRGDESFGDFLDISER